jgi:hypothetical protein
MPSETPTPSTALWKYDRLCERTDEVVDRYSGVYAQVATFETTLKPLTRSYRAQSDAVDLFEREARLLTKIGQTQIDLLKTFMRSWATTLSAHLGDFDVSPLVRPQVANDVIIQAKKLAQRLRYSLEHGLPSFDGTQALIDQLQQLIDRAEAAWAAAQQALAELQDKRAALRLMAAELNQALIAFRRVLRTLLGTKHRDYQKLRTRRIRQNDTDLGDPPTEPHA